MSKQPPPAPTASAVDPCPTVILIVGRPGTRSLPSTIAPPDHPHIVWILRLMNFTIELIDYMMLLYLQGVILNMLFVQSLIPKLIILDILSKFLLLIKEWTLLIYRAFSEINRYNHPYQIISRIMKYHSFVTCINIINLLGALYLILINLFLTLISKLVTLTPETARTLNMFIRLRVMLLRAI